MAVLPSYSIAIRTFGLSGEVFRRELESLYTQTVQPFPGMVNIVIINEICYISQINQP